MRPALHVRDLFDPETINLGIKAIEFQPGNQALGERLCADPLPAR